jgi:L-ascorbate metabolism protein UlaG (beta-lactamase superfamily)
VQKIAHLNIFHFIQEGGIFMKIKWFGQSSFLLTSQAGIRILIDPYNRFLGYRMPIVEADIVVVTHDHRDHNQIQAASGKYLLVNQPAEYDIEGVKIQGIKTFHDKQNGAKRGDNIVFVFRMEGLSVCHCGDLGHLLTLEQIREIGQVDILILPVGGTMTINGVEAVQVMRQLNPTITIPMHYRTKATGIVGWLLFDKVDKFILAAELGTTDVKELNISRDRLSEYTGVVTFKYE